MPDRAREHGTNFSTDELEKIKALLREIRQSDRPRQKTLRGKLRRQFGFYITDFAADQQGFTASDVDDLVQRGVIRVVDGHAEIGEILPSDLASSPGTRSEFEDVAISGAGTPVSSGFERRDLETAGFVGWRPWAELRASGFVGIPTSPAVYVVYRPDASDPQFLLKNPGGRFKDRDPTVSLATLEAKWVPGARTVYIGKADEARRRLGQFARFGAGERVGHWGGRYIWQLVDSTDLLVAWHAITWNETARTYEKRLLARFAELYDGRRPFANLTG